MACDNNYFDAEKMRNKQKQDEQKPNLPLNVRDQDELIRIVARNVQISEDELRNAIKNIPMGWYKGNLSYWRVLDIASNIKK